MKLILAIINNDDAPAVSNALTERGFFATKLATTGGFLKAGNTTFLIGVDDSEVNNVIDTLSKYSRKRGGVMPEFLDELGASAPMEVTVGGATVFVMNIERFEKL